VALRREEVKRLMTIPGVDATVALSIVAAVGDFRRFSSPASLVSYLGLNPRVRQFGWPAGLARADHQAGACAPPWHAGRGGMGSEVSWPGPSRRSATSGSITGWLNFKL
jgi:hypothetical protein